MRSFFEPTAAPSWLKQVLSSIRAALGDIWPAPLRLKDYADAELPAAAEFGQGLAWNATRLTITWSDGTHWIEPQPLIAAGSNAQYWRGDKSWQALNAAAVANSPAGNIAATKVQAALNELDGEKLAAANNLSDLASTAAARTNLGLGTAALKDTGTSGGKVPLLDGANTWSGVTETFSNGLSSTGFSFSGSGVHLGFAGGGGNLTAYNLPGSAYLAMVFDAASHRFDVNGVTVAQFGSGLLTLSGAMLLNAGTSGATKYLNANLSDTAIGSGNKTGLRLLELGAMVGELTIVRDGTSNQIWLNTIAGGSVTIGVNGANVARFTGSSMAVTGNITGTGYLSAAGNIGTTGGSFYLNGNPVAAASGSYHIIYSPIQPAFYIGNLSDPTTYYDNTTHQWRSAGGGTIYARMNGTGLGLGTGAAAAKLDVQQASDTNTNGIRIARANGVDAMFVYIAAGGLGAVQDCLNFYTTFSSSIIASLGRDGALILSSYVRPGSFTVAGVPSASTSGAGATAYISNESGGAVLAFSDGTNWRRVTDRAIIS